MTDLLFVFAGLLVGIILGYVLMSLKKQRKNIQLQEGMMISEKKRVALDERLRIMEIEKAELLKNLESEREKYSAISLRLASQEADNRNLQQKMSDYKKELEELNKKFNLEFENIASRILRQNTTDFVQSNQKNLEGILNPLKDRIEKFEKAVSETYEKGIRDQTDLKAEIKSLHDLNKRISEEASNLTKALRADSKKQGNWGEMILDRVLERSGLVKGEEYIMQYSDRNQDGELIRPDVIVNLPENKHIIIDSKVSLLAYDAFVNESDEDKKEMLLKSHIDSIKEHVKSLGQKSYQDAPTLDTPDFVLLFLPVESAFSIAIQHEPGLFNLAWDKKIVIVSPTTLLATLKTVASIWRHEKQTQNALEIARQSGNLYDKFVSFLGDLEKIGVQLKQTQNTYDEAHKKLISGSGNIVGRIEKLKKLGAKASKEIPAHLIEEDDEKE